MTRLSRAERQLLLAGLHPDDSGIRCAADAMVNAFAVARAAGLKPGSLRERAFTWRMPVLGFRGLVRCLSEGSYILTDRGRDLRENLRSSNKSE